MNNVVIVGGGISGLSAAHYLSKAGIRPTLIEREGRLGGVIKTDYEHGCVLEGGPDSFLAAKPAALELIQEVGLAEDVISSNDHLRKTYILKNGKLVPLPDGLMMMVPTKIMPLIGTSLLSWNCKLNMGIEMLRRPGPPREDRSVADFLLDHYGREALDYLAEPLLAGVYGGDPTKMSVNSVLGRFVEIEQKYGSLSRGALAVPRPQSSGGSLFRTLRHGLGSLVEKLSKSVNLIHGTAEALSPQDDGFRVRVNGSWTAPAHVVLAIPAYCAADLLEPISDPLAALLRTTPYNDSTTLTLGYRKSQFSRPVVGFGFLVPKKERRSLTACTWVNNKFSGRAPDDVVLLRCFLGGNAIHWSDETILQSSREELKRIMGLDAEPFFHRISRWPAAMAQYTVGHEKRIAQMEALTAALPSLSLIGNGYRGIGIPDCIKLGKETAARIATASPLLEPR